MYWILILLFFSGGWFFFPKSKPVNIPPPHIPFENYYMLGIPHLEEKEELKEIGVVEEETPEGIVRMKWVEDHFLYWSNRPIQYKYLETVARKYCIVYDCRDKYINIFRELAIASLKPVQEQIHPEVFASFKQYNTKRKQIKNKVIINERCNQYIWKGKISEYEKEKEKEQEIEPVRELSYSDYKKM
jgi:hypothetical protein